jgi:hypothetical protein
MSSLGFKILAPLPEKAKNGSYLLVAMNRVNQLAPQIVYNIQDTKPREFGVKHPQCMSCTFHGAYHGNLYSIEHLRYFSNEKNDYVEYSSEDSNCKMLLSIIAQLLDAEIVLLDDNFNYISNF